MSILKPTMSDIGNKIIQVHEVSVYDDVLTNE